MTGVANETVFLDSFIGWWTGSCCGDVPKPEYATINEPPSNPSRLIAATADCAGHKSCLEVACILGLDEYTVYKYSYKNSMKPGNQPLRSVRLPDQVCQRIRHLHFGLSTDKV